MSKGAFAGANAAKIVAVHETSQTAGLITWWALGGTLALDTLQREWTRAGFDGDDLPRAPSNAVALKRALRSLYPKALVLPLPKTAGYVVAEQDFEENAVDEKPDPVQRTLFKAWFDAEGVLKCAGPAFSNDPSIRRSVFATHQRQQEELDASHDLSPWLIKMADKYHGVTLRQSGGVYFIPSSHTNSWRRMADVIERCSNSSIYEIPAMRTEKAIDAILSALQLEVAAEVQRLEEQLNEGEMGIRALKGRQHATNELLGKVVSYETLLGANLEKLRISTEAVQDKITQAMLAAE